MMVREDIIAELTANPIMKIDVETTQRDIDNLKNELAKHAAKIKTTKDIVEQSKKYGFLIIDVELLK